MSISSDTQIVRLGMELESIDLLCIMKYKNGEEGSNCDENRKLSHKSKSFRDEKKKKILWTIERNQNHQMEAAGHFDCFSSFTWNATAQNLHSRARTHTHIYSRTHTVAKERKL